MAPPENLETSIDSKPGAPIVPVAFGTGWDFAKIPDSASVRRAWKCSLQKGSESRPQIQLPIFPEGVTHITPVLAFSKQDGRVTYFNRSMPVFVHVEEPALVQPSRRQASHDVGTSAHPSEALGLSNDMEDQIDVPTLLKTCRGVPIYREPEAIVPHVRFCGGGRRSDPAALLTKNPQSGQVPARQPIASGGGPVQMGLELSAHEQPETPQSQVQ